VTLAKLAWRACNGDGSHTLLDNNQRLNSFSVVARTFQSGPKDSRNLHSRIGDASDGSPSLVTKSVPVLPPYAIIIIMDDDLRKWKCM
jgi:hypothetical protein